MYFDGIPANLEGVISILKSLYSAEICSRHAYQVHAQQLTGQAAPGLERELLEHAEQEGHHARLLADLIRDLGGFIETRVGDIPAFTFNHEDAETAGTNAGMLALDLAAELKAISAYGEAIRMFRNTEWFDVALVLGHIQRQEREHAQDLSSFLAP